MVFPEWLFVVILFVVTEEKEEEDEEKKCNQLFEERISQNFSTFSHLQWLRSCRHIHSENARP